MITRPKFSLEELVNSYNEVYCDFKNNGNLRLKDFSSSRNLFSDVSLKENEPEPKKLEVIAVVAGLPFSNEFQTRLVNLQLRIQNIIGNSLAYWVKPENFGLELFVTKWPEQKYSPDQIIFGQKFLANFDHHSFMVEFCGFQVHRDGCVVLRGIDENAIIRRSRHELIEKKLIPKRQSSWSHVPLGRILEPFSDYSYEKLISFIEESQQSPSFKECVDNVKLVHEHRWYMEERDTLYQKNLANQ